MKRKRLFSFGALVIAVFSLVIGVASPVMAASGQGGNALRISPVRTDTEIAPGSSKTTEVYVENLTTEPAVLHAIVNDFVASKDESGTPSIILDENKSAPVRSLKQYVAPIADFTLQPSERKMIPVVISIPKGADAGGYFGAVRFAPASNNANKMLTLSASVGSLFLVKVPGELKEEASISSFEIRRNDMVMLSPVLTSKKDLKGVIRVQNNGNVQLQPYGKVLLKKAGKVVATYEINNEQPRGNVLPDSIRRFEFNLDKLGSFGKYTLEANLGYGSKGQLLTATKTFYMIPVGALIAVGVIVVAIVVAIFVLPRMIKNYNARVIRKATGGRGKKK